jgi:hypothetical protein
VLDTAVLSLSLALHHMRVITKRVTHPWLRAHAAFGLPPWQSAVHSLLPEAQTQVVQFPFEHVHGITAQYCKG